MSKNTNSFAWTYLISHQIPTFLGKFVIWLHREKVMAIFRIFFAVGSALHPSRHDVLCCFPNRRWTSLINDSWSTIFGAVQQMKKRQGGHAFVAKPDPELHSSIYFSSFGKVPFSLQKIKPSKPEMASTFDFQNGSLPRKASLHSPWEVANFCFPLNQTLLVEVLAQSLSLASSFFFWVLQRVTANRTKSNWWNFTFFSWLSCDFQKNPRTTLTWLIHKLKPAS